MAHTLIVIVLFFVIFLAPCVVAMSIDMEEEEAMAEQRQRGASSQSRTGSLSRRENRSSS